MDLSKNSFAFPGPYSFTILSKICPENDPYAFSSITPCFSIPFSMITCASLSGKTEGDFDISAS